MAALEHVQQSLPSVSLQLNTSKSHFTYFHAHITPLTATILNTLSSNDIKLHHDWVGCVGVVVGRNDAATSTVCWQVAGSHDALLRRLQLHEMPIQVAMLLLRQSMVPAVSYYLRCIAPVCVAEEAHRFDKRVLDAEMDKMGLGESERTERTATLLQRRLRDGGWSLTSAVRTSPAAFLASVASCHDEPAFEPYCGASPVPNQSQLHGWVEDSIQRVRQAASGDKYQTELEPLLPAHAGDIFSFYSTTQPSVTTNLQRSLSVKANTHNIKAAVQVLKEKAKNGSMWEQAHQRATSADGAWAWKVVRPEDPHLQLSDVEYAKAVRLNIGLKPFSPDAMARLPTSCLLCRRRGGREPVTLGNDPWHWMTCRMTTAELTRRHDAVVDVVSRVARQVGAQVRTEVKGTRPEHREATRSPNCFLGQTAPKRRSSLPFADTRRSGGPKEADHSQTEQQEREIRQRGGTTGCGTAQPLCRHERWNGERCDQAGAGHR